jgi:hypothetical protein
MVADEQGWLIADRSEIKFAAVVQGTGPQGWRPSKWRTWSGSCTFIGKNTVDSPNPCLPPNTSQPRPSRRKPQPRALDSALGVLGLEVERPGLLTLETEPQPAPLIHLSPLSLSSFSEGGTSRHLEVELDTVIRSSGDPAALGLSLFVCGGIFRDHAPPPIKLVGRN